MGFDYRCRSCGLKFALGWDHYHRIDQFAAETKLVCRACGTAHRIEHAVGGEVPDRLWSATGPDTPASRRNLLIDPGWWLCVVYVDLRPAKERHAFCNLEGVNDPLNLASVCCGHCRAVGSLVKDLSDEDVRCPHCKQPSLECVRGWMT